MSEGVVVGLRKMHQRRGAGGGVRACGARREPCGVWAVRACGARARERAESSGAERGEGTGQREGAERETASPMVLHCVMVEYGRRHFENF